MSQVGYPVAGFESRRLRHLEGCLSCGSKKRAGLRYYLISRGVAWRHDPYTRTSVRETPLCDSDAVTVSKTRQGFSGWQKLPHELVDNILEYVVWHYLRTREYQDAAQVATLTKPVSQRFYQLMRGDPRWEGGIATPIEKACGVSRYLFLMAYTFDELYTSDVRPPENALLDSEMEEDWFTSDMVPWIALSHPYKEYPCPVDPLRLPAFRKHGTAISAHLEALEPERVKLDGFVNRAATVGWTGRRACDALILDATVMNGLVRVDTPPQPTMLLEIKNGNGASMWKEQMRAWQLFAGFMRLGTPGLQLFIKEETYSVPGRVDFVKIVPPYGW